MSTSAKDPRDVIVGERPSAGQVNDQNELLRFLAAYRSRLFLNPLNLRAWSESQLHQILAVDEDYLECVRIYLRKRGDPITGTKLVKVARPERLRASEALRDGVSYTYTDHQTRTATKGADSEVQRVTPSYLLGELIEVRPLRGLSGVDEVDSQRRALVDANVDGRAWAAEPPPEP